MANNNTECEDCKGPLDNEASAVCDACLMTAIHGSQSHDSDTPSSGFITPAQLYSSHIPDTQSVGNTLYDKCIFPGCTLGSVARIGLTKCIWCRQIYHKKCVGPEVYICVKCRVVPTQVSHLSTIVNTLAESVQTLITENRELRKTINVQCTTIGSLEKSIGPLGNRPTSISVTNVPDVDLVIGSSVVRNIDENKLKSTKVTSISGGRIRHVRDRLDQDGRRYRRITLCVGGNDCGAKTDQQPIEDIIDSYRALVIKAMSQCEQVYVGSVLPRCAAPGVSERIDTLNAALLDLCLNTDNVTFLNNDDVFKLRNNSLNEGFYVADKTHPNAAGTSHLAKSLQLNILPDHVENVALQRRSYAKAAQRNRQPQPAAQRRPEAPAAPSHADRREPTRHDVTPQRHAEERRRNEGYHDDAMSRDHYDHGSRGAGPWQTVSYGRRTHTQSRDNDRMDHDEEWRRTQSGDRNWDHELRQTCEYCNERNHNKHTCHHGQPVKCDRCHCFGHKAKHCHRDTFA